MNLKVNEWTGELMRVPDPENCEHRDNQGLCELLGHRSCKDNVENCPKEATDGND